jgi:hypothetical protein
MFISQSLIFIISKNAIIYRLLENYLHIVWGARTG